MKKLIVLTLLICSAIYVLACSGDSTIVKRYRLKEKVAFETTVKITCDNNYSFYIDGKNYIDYMSKTFKFIGKYHDFKDTLYIEITSTYDSIKRNTNYSLRLKLSQKSESVEYYSENTINKPNFSVFSFYWNSFGYIVHKPLIKKKLIIFNERTKQYQMEVIKEKYSFYCDELAACGGVRWKIKDTNTVFYNVTKWIS